MDQPPRRRPRPHPHRAIRVAHRHAALPRQPDPGAAAPRVSAASRHVATAGDARPRHRHPGLGPEDATDAVFVRPGAALSGPAPFESISPITVLPITADAYYKRRLTPDEEASMQQVVASLTELYGIDARSFPPARGRATHDSSSVAARPATDSAGSAIRDHSLLRRGQAGAGGLRAFGAHDRHLVVAGVAGR